MAPTPKPLFVVLASGCSTVGARDDSSVTGRGCLTAIRHGSRPRPGKRLDAQGTAAPKTTKAEENEHKGEPMLCRRGGTGGRDALERRRGGGGSGGGGLREGGIDPPP